MNQFEVVAEPRSALGKGASRRLRRAGRVPGVLYGAGREPVSLSMEASRIGKQMENEAFFSHILAVKVDGEEAQAVVKDLQRDPATSQILHVDLQRVSSTEELHMRVPLHFVNEADSPGKRHGGVISHLMVDVEIGCLPRDLPEFIEVDMSGLDVGDSLHLSDLAMSDRVRLMPLVHDPENDQPVVTVQHPQKLEAVEEDVGEEFAEGEGAPAAGTEAEGASPDGGGEE
jgi:large subunit ribosomal protein L25